MSVELPKDAEGREIPFDTKVLYTGDGRLFIVEKVERVLLIGSWCYRGYVGDKEHRYSAMASCFHLTPPDSWEKLEEDLGRCIKADSLCAYSPSEECSTCVLPRDSQCHCDSLALEAIKERIRELRGEGE